MDVFETHCSLRREASLRREYEAGKKVKDNFKKNSNKNQLTIRIVKIFIVNIKNKNLLAECHLVV